MQKINCKEIFVISFFLVCNLFIGFGNSQLIKTASSTALISTILGFIIGFIPIYLIIYISKYTTDKNIFELLEYKFKFVGKIINLLLFLSLLLMGIISIWNIMNFTISQFLSETPYFLVGLIVFLLTTIAAIKGIETIGRTGTVFMPIFIIFTIFVWVSLIPSVETNNILPIMNISKMNFIKSIIMCSTYSTFPLFLLLSIRQNDIVDKENFKKAIILSYVLGFLCLYIVGFFILSVFGVNLAKIYTYPEYSLFKEIRIYGFIEKVENILSIILYIVFLISDSFETYFNKEFLKNMFKLKKEKDINITIIIFEIITTLLTIFIFIKYQPLYLINKYYLLSIPTLIIFIIIAFLLGITKKEKA